ncbi:MAG TPA: GYD domain-containing protein [Acidimicrobiia bacterium]|nr:GYD domain-containing protein [Acidimicrobiia bacterium]
MPTYIVLAHMTQQGVQNAKEIPQRRAAAKEAAQALGITLRESYLTMGAYDVVLVLDAPSGEAMAKFALRIGMRGNLTTQTLRAFSDAETDTILSDL